MEDRSIWLTAKEVDGEKRGRRGGHLELALSLSLPGLTNSLPLFSLPNYLVTLSPRVSAHRSPQNLEL